ncbi:hypothetical protein [Desulfocurvibacter africanus]|uniref:hypothetical protein n=1 Tax=Desulfocurvibacter africanus TaxID=873 RepID=UPI0005C15CF4|nr:hypothetical protein [Desulfocurvibacter africanus]
MTAPGANCFIRSSNTDASGEMESKPNEGRFVWIQRMKIGSGQVVPAIAVQSGLAAAIIFDAGSARVHGLTCARKRLYIRLSRG